MSGSLYVYMYVCMYLCVYVYMYIYIYAPPPPARSTLSWLLGRARNTGMLKKIQNFQPQNSRNAVMLNKWGRFLEILDFLSITVFRGF